MTARRKLTRLYVEDFKKLEFIDIVIGEHVTEISGRNGSGKSTGFHALDVLLNKMTSAPAVPIRRGAKQALLGAELGDLVVERTFKPDSDGKIVSKATLKTRDGAKYPSVQEHLDRLKGSHILDPLKLIHQLLTKPVDVLKHFVDVDFDAIERANLGDYDRRTQVNTLAKQSRAAAALIVVPDNTPDEAVDDSALVDELQKANDQNAKTERRRAGREQHLQRIGELTRAAELVREQAADLRRQADELDRRAAKQAEEAATMQKQYDEAEPLSPTIDVAEIRLRIDGAKAINAAVQKRIEKVKHEHVAIKYEQESKALTERIDARKTQMATAIAEANLPIQNIGLKDGVFMLNALPFEQASHGEQLRTAFGFIVASDPDAEVRLAWVHDAAVLDDVALAEMEQLAVEMDVQVLLETVRPTSASAIVLEDGHVKGSNGELIRKPAPPSVDNVAVADTGPRKLNDEFALSSDPPTPARPARRKFQGPGAPTGDA